MFIVRDQLHMLSKAGRTIRAVILELDRVFIRSLELF